MTEIDPSPKTNKVKRFFSNLKNNWRTSTKAGEVLGYREILSFSFAGSGMNGVGYLASLVSLYSSTILIGSIYRISAAVLYLMASLITLFGLVRTPIISLIMDNTGKRGGKGKFKPFLLWLGIPSAILICLIPFVPVSWADIAVFSVLEEDVSRAAIAIFLIHLLISFTFPVLLVAYTGLGQTITPNTLERGKVYSFQPVISGFWPSVIGIIFPLLASLTQQDAATGLESILSYRVFFPIFGLISFVLVLFAYLNVEERIIVAKDYKPKIKFWHGLKSFSSNKYFWIVITGMALMNVRAATNIVPWINVYSIKEDYATSLSTLILGITLVPGMLLTGYMVKKFGKRTLMVVSGFISTALFIPIIIFPQYPILLLTIMALQNVSFGFQTCLAIMPADALDFQHLKTGERLEGFFGNFNQLMIGLIMIIAGLVVPFILQASGMPDGADILKINRIRYAVFRNLNIFAMIVVFLATIPYLFWDLSEEKHKKIIEELEIIARKKNGVVES